VQATCPPVTVVSILGKGGKWRYLVISEGTADDLLAIRGDAADEAQVFTTGTPWQTHISSMKSPIGSPITGDDLDRPGPEFTADDLLNRPFSWSSQASRETLVVTTRVYFPFGASAPDRLNDLALCCSGADQMTIAAILS